MTKDKKFKKKVRERMERTGENYVTARRALLDEAERNDGLRSPPIPDPEDEPPVEIEKD